MGSQVIRNPSNLRNPFSEIKIENIDSDSKFPTKSTKTFNIKTGKLQYLSSTFESLDYDIIENELLIEDEEVKGYQYFVKKNAVKWAMFFLIGLCTATIASTVDIAISYLSRKKYLYLIKYIELYEYHSRYLVLILWTCLNTIPFLLGLLLVTYLEPLAAGSGIPLVKCYLNGVDIPRVLALKTLFIKATGLVCTIVGGLASGKEGPMIHIGACVANLISMGNISFFGKKIHIFRYFRCDAEMRDLVSAGAASGVSAAFGASVGGVLFSLEEGASFWNQSLTWRIFFASVISKFTVNLILSAYYHHPGDLEHPSLVNLGKCDYKYEIFEIPIFMLMGVLGGALGAMWNYLNFNLSVIRITVFQQRWIRIIEGIIVSGLTAVAAFLMTFYMQECKDRNSFNFGYQPKVGCTKEGQYNILASMWLQTPQASVKSLLHDPPGSYSFIALITFAIGYYLLSCISFGLSSSNGIFIPSLLTGAAWGRLLCMMFSYLLPPLPFLVPGKYALIGAAAQLGGVVRMTISLTVIIMETSDNITFSLPIILTLICAKMTGDFFNDGMYDVAIKLKAVPFLYWEAPVLTHSVRVSEIMHQPAVSVNLVEKVTYVLRILADTTHNGFAVVEPLSDSNSDRRFGPIKGLVLRSQLMVLLVNKMFVETRPNWNHLSNLDTFNDSYVHKYVMDDLKLDGLELQYSLDFRAFMNHSPYTLLHTASLPRAFRLFRALGLRHLPIVNERYAVVGMITRKDLAKFKMYRHVGRLNLYTLNIV